MAGHGFRHAVGVVAAPVAALQVSFSPRLRHAAGVLGVRAVGTAAARAGERPSSPRRRRGGGGGTSASPKMEEPPWSATIWLLSAFNVCLIASSASPGAVKEPRAPGEKDS